MKPFKSIVVVNHPVDLVWVTVRDRLPEIAAMLDDVNSVTVVEHEDARDGVVRQVNRWRSRTKIPEMLAKVVEADDLGWLDRAEWSEKDRCCRWTIEPSFLPGSIRCEGASTYAPAMGGRGARVTFEGTLDIDMAGQAALSGALARPLSAVAESVVSNLIPKNFRKTLEAAASLIEGEG